MKLSILLPTASPTFALVDPALAGVSVFEPLAESLDAQADDIDIEVVIVDSLAGEREDQHLFRYDHKYIKAPDTYCKLNGLSHHCADRNAGLAACSGEIIYQVDDWCWFDHDPHHLARVVDFYERGLSLGALVRWRCGSGDDPSCAPLNPEDQGVQVDWRAADWPSGPDGRPRVWVGDGKDPKKPRAFGVQAFSRRAAYAIGGYNELFDGGRGYSDLDFGVRLQLSGQRLALSLDHLVTHQKHGSGASGINHCNRALHMLNQELESWMDPCANHTPPGAVYIRALLGDREKCPFYVGGGRCGNGDSCDFEGGVGQEEWLQSRPKIDLERWHHLLLRAHGATEENQK